jgi:RNA polymerase sigma-70 factor (ECF subfamily)
LDQLGDTELILLLDRGESAALQLLVQRYHGALTGYLFRLLGGDHLLAEDLAQEAFIRVLRHRHQHIEHSFKAWLFAIATNLARDELKSSVRRRCVALEEDVEQSLTDPTPGPEEQALARERNAKLITALGRLNLEYRTTLLLRFYNDLSLDEISEALHIPVGTVKSRLSMGLRQLRNTLTAFQSEVYSGG